jgi:hypothetical protein
MKMSRNEWNEEEKSIFKEFKDQLGKVKTVSEAKSLIKKAPPIDTPGRIYYTRFDMFLRGIKYCQVPKLSEYEVILYEEEIILYREFIKMLIDNNQIGLDEGEKILNELKYLQK